MSSKGSPELRAPNAGGLDVVVLGLLNKPKVADEARTVCELAAPLARSVVADIGFLHPWPDPPPDVAIVIGGDGSIMEAARHMGSRQIPILGVNLGKLGFMADLLPNELSRVLPDVCAGRCQVVEHLMYECTVFDNGQPSHRLIGLNEVTLRAGEPFTILDVDLYVDGELVTTYSCDGVIISTPIGSTAHNLSAGGPILRKELQAFVVSPLSPHTLSNRPVVDSADSVYDLTVRHPHPGTSLVADGKLITKLLPHQRVQVKRAVPRFKLIQVAGHGYYRTLRLKLGWGGRIRPNDSEAG